MDSRLEKAAQIVFPRLGSNMVPPIRVADDFARFKQLLSAYPFGGLVLFNGDASTTPLALAELQALTNVPLLVGSDIERGAGQQLEGATLFPHARASGLAGLEATRQFAHITAREALAGGIHIAFSPVADVNANPRNPIIGIRAFGTKPGHVQEHVQAFISSCQAAGLYATAKHFPGHGDTAADSHAELPVVTSTLAHLKTHDLAPFIGAIEAGVSSIMTAHVSFTALDPAGSPATSSRPVLTDLLRQQLGFDGLIITDSLIMEGIWTQGASVADAAARMINAGVDVLLDPPDPAAMVEGIVHALEAGTLHENQLDRSIDRLQRLRGGLIERFSDRIFTHPDTVFTDIKPGHDKHVDTARQIAFQAISHTDAHENRPGHTQAVFVLPYKTHLDPPEQPIGVMLRAHFPNITFDEISDTTNDHELDRIETASTSAANLLLFVVSKPAAWRAFGVPPRLKSFIDRIIAKKPAKLIAMGDPGILDFFQGKLEKVCTYSDTEPSQYAIVKWLKDL